ncbi:hypothetical protein [Pseudomonas turukhanskensis]|uniref:Uncharacterized protein n=1 Tax=Pseudomonas turukhanskensis TaxID=1806536 RepID=A0A9W6NG17_9PSED|nr:hypothetical protein [Pseudomonas turukhanskensis]GLK89380.1 hypothetical protein GCM10017655_24420 [Pseudomonas turukhanskensis]
MSLSVVDKVFLVVGIIDFVGLLVWIGTCLLLAHTKLDLMLEHLKNCSAVMARTPLKHGGPLGKILLIGGISGLVTFPSFYLKRGELSADDLNNFPASLKHTLAILQWCGISLVLIMCVMWAAIQLGII